MPRLVAGPPQHAAPSTYKLAPSEAFIPEAVTATFDGTGAGGTFLPTLSVYSQDGKLIARSPATQITAGNSAEVTFAPLLRAAQVAAAGGGGYPFAISGTNGSYNVPSGVTTAFGTDAGAIQTSDPSIFTIDAGLPAGVFGLGVHATGTYRLDWTIQFWDTAGAPVANPQNFVCEASSFSGSENVILPDFGSDFARGFVNLSGRSEWDVVCSNIGVVHGGTAPNDPFQISAIQNTGATLQAFTMLVAYQLSTDTFGF